MPYVTAVHTVIETNAYLRAAKVAGIDPIEQQAIVDLIAADPQIGEIMPGCGGARKLRIARPGGGKSGGYRVVTYFAGETTPVFPAHGIPEEREDQPDSSRTERVRRRVQAAGREPERTMMARKAFEMMMAGMADAIAYTEGDDARARVSGPIDVKTVRARTKKSQAEFARSFRLPIGTVRDWEQRRRQPDAPARVLLAMIESDPESVERLVAKLG